MTAQEILNLPMIQDWLEWLESNPDKQLTGRLGFVKPETKEIEKCCCLGALTYMNDCLTDKNTTIYPYHQIINGQHGYGNLGDTYARKFYLNSGTGEFRFKGDKRLEEFVYEFIRKNTSLKENITFEKHNWQGLAGLNDYGATFPEIALVIKTFPQIVFSAE